MYEHVSSSGTTFLYRYLHYYSMFFLPHSAQGIDILCVCVYVFIFRCMCMLVEIKGQPCDSSSVLTCLAFRVRVSHWTLRLPVHPGWLSRKLYLSRLHLPNAVIASVGHNIWLFMWVQGTRLRFKCFCGKHFPNGAVLTVTIFKLHICWPTSWLLFSMTASCPVCGEIRTGAGAHLHMRDSKIRSMSCV